MKTLAIDTSGGASVLAIRVDGELRVESATGVKTRLGETLLPHLERVLEQAGVRASELDLLAVGLGPGSFTGVRIGVATAKGLALARGTPVVGVRTTRVIARGLEGLHRVAIVDAAKGEVFVAAYEALAAQGPLATLLFEDDHGPPRDVAARLRAALGPDVAPTLAGSGLDRYGPAFCEALGACVVAAPAYAAPRGELLAIEAEEAFAARGADDPDQLEPLYVRASDATLPSA